MVRAADATVQHLRSIVLQVLHEPRLSVVHQIVLVGGSSGILGIVESRCRCIGIGAKIVYVEVLVDAHQSISAVAGVVKGSVGVAADRATSIRKFASRIWFVRLVQRVRMVVSRLLPATTDRSVVSAVIMDHIAAARADRGEVADV